MTSFLGMFTDHSPFLQPPGEQRPDGALNTLRHANLSHSTLEPITLTQRAVQSPVLVCIVLKHGFRFSVGQLSHISPLNTVAWIAAFAVQGSQALVSYSSTLMCIATILSPSVKTSHGFIVVHPHPI